MKHFLYILFSFCIISCGEDEGQVEQKPTVKPLTASQIQDIKECYAPVGVIIGSKSTGGEGTITYKLLLESGDGASSLSINNASNGVPRFHYELEKGSVWSAKIESKDSKGRKKVGRAVTVTVDSDVISETFTVRVGD